MSSLPVEKAFIAVLHALAELEALSSTEAFPDAQVWAHRLGRRLNRYLALNEARPPFSVQVLGQSMQPRLNSLLDALARARRDEVFRASAELRDEVAAHYRARGKAQSEVRSHQPQTLLNMRRPPFGAGSCSKKSPGENRCR